LFRHGLLLSSDFVSASASSQRRIDATVRSPLGSEHSASLRASLPNSTSLGFASLRASLPNSTSLGFALLRASLAHSTPLGFASLRASLA
jgi:hypothetical protein